MRAWRKPVTTCYASTLTRARSSGSSKGTFRFTSPASIGSCENGRQAGRLEFTTDIAAGVEHGLFQFIAVGTPPGEDGSADLSHVVAVARSIGEHLSDYRIIVDKSTVPVGTADLVRAEVQDVLNQRGHAIDFDVISNPEFLKEGAAIEDFMKPDRIVIGTDNPHTAELHARAVRAVQPQPRTGASS